MWLFIKGCVLNNEQRSKNNSYNIKTKKMSKRDELIVKYAADLKVKCGVVADMDLLTKVTIGCGPSDVRVTVRYQEDNVMKAFGAGVHEIGHALHGLQRKQEWSDLPVNNLQYPSFGESQSRLMENHIGLSSAFWQSYYPWNQSRLFNSSST